jgi:AbrB family looped-hinge helix DNA binding protein
LYYSKVRSRILTVATKITSKGQVTVPKKVRDRMGLRPGDTVDFVEQGGQVHLVKAPKQGAFSAHRGYLKGLAGTDPDVLVDRLRGA